MHGSINSQPDLINSLFDGTLHVYEIIFITYFLISEVGSVDGINEDVMRSFLSLNVSI